LHKDLIRKKNSEGRNGKDVQEEVLSRERADLLVGQMQLALKNY